MLVSQQYRAWSDCTVVQAGQALYWWQRLITFGVGRKRINPYPANTESIQYIDPCSLTKLYTVG